jgi:hypothetical protein
MTVYKCSDASGTPQRTIYFSKSFGKHWLLVMMSVETLRQIGTDELAHGLYEKYAQKVI